MKFPRNTWVVIILLTLFCVSMKIAVTLPPRDRSNWQIDADKMVAGVFSDKGQGDLNLDLKTGKLEFDSPEEVVVSDDPLAGWRLVSRLRVGNKESRQWGLIVANPDGSESETKFQFRSQPSVLDVNTIFDVSENGLDVLDLRTNTLSSQTNGPRIVPNARRSSVLPSRRYLEIRYMQIQT